MRRVRRTPGLVDEHRRRFYRELELLMETGLGLATGQGSDPQVHYRYSNDGGKTFGPMRLATAGAIGAYRTRVRWWNNGSGRHRVDEIVVSDPIPWRITDAFLSVDGAQYDHGVRLA